MITRENYEEYLLLLADGELSPSEAEELKAFVKGNSELEQELAYYMSTRMIPDANEIYTGKEALLKKAGGARIVGLQRSWAYGIAAGILLLIFLGFYHWQAENPQFLNPNSNLQIVKKDTSGTNSQFPIPNSHKTPIVKQEEHPSTIPASRKPVMVRMKTTRPINNIVRVENPKQNTSNSIAAKTFESINPDSLMNLQTDIGDREKKIRQNPAERDAPHGPLQSQYLDSAIIALNKIKDEEEPKPKRNFFARLPVVGKRNVGINLVTDAVEDKISKAKQIKHNLKNTDVVIKVGNKELLAFNL